MNIATFVMVTACQITKASCPCYKESDILECLNMTSHTFTCKYLKLI
uniref:Uncharacterized protein n=1 Tax=Rhizophora mucronata TaxID=61149 RepID=A0A2P2P0L8_RHIMU